MFASLIFPSCQTGPSPIVYGKDACEQCKMLITDVQYGAELVTKKGKVYKFDSIECLVDYYLEKNVSGDEIGSLSVVDFLHPSNLVNAHTALYLKNDIFHSPMGLNILAVRNNEEMKKLTTQFGGEVLDWNKVLELVKKDKPSAM